MRQSVVCLVAGWLLLGLWQLAIAAEKEGAKPGLATYVGNEVCQACHAPAFEKFSTTLMGKIFLHNPRNETEKGPAKIAMAREGNHVAAGGGKGTGGMITFRKNSGETAKVQNEPCLGCHQRGVQTFWEASPHASRGLSCVNCHTLMEKTGGCSQR